MKGVLIGIAIALLLVSGYWVGSKLDPEKLIKLFRTEEFKKGKDTVFIKQPPPPPIVIEVPKWKIKTIVRDSIVPIYIEKSFTKIIDTVQGDFWWHSEYFFPEDSSIVKYQLPPKEIAYIHDTIRITNPSLPFPIQSSYGVTDFMKDAGLFILGGIIGNKIK